MWGKGPWVIQMSARSAAQGRGIRGRWTFQVWRFSWCASPEYVSTIPGAGQSGPAADASGGGRVNSASPISLGFEPAVTAGPEVSQAELLEAFRLAPRGDPQSGHRGSWVVQAKASLRLQGHVLLPARSSPWSSPRWLLASPQLPPALLRWGRSWCPVPIRFQHLCFPQLTRWAHVQYSHGNLPFLGVREVRLQFPLKLFRVGWPNSRSRRLGKFCAKP